MEIVKIDQLGAAAELANSIVIVFFQMKYPTLNESDTNDFILDADGNYTVPAQELFNFWNEYYYDILTKHKIA